MSYFYLFIRKCRSLGNQMINTLYTKFCYVSVFGNSSISIAANCSFGRGVLLKATDGGSISIGSLVSLANGVQIITQGGRVRIEDNVFIGTGTIIVCRDDIFIGKDTLIAEYVVIRDQDHRTDSRPVRLAGFHSTPIRIGRDVWIGCKASILRGSSLGDHCVIGAHALVKSNIPDGTLAVGTPARSIRRVEDTN